MRYTGIQPQYFPRLHYISRILNTDIFVIRDDAQFVRKHKYPGGQTDKSYQADTPIKQATGRYLLSVPIMHEGMLPIAHTKISYEHFWVRNHTMTIRQAYLKSPNFNLLYPEIETLLTQEYASLGELNIATIVWAISRLLYVKYKNSRETTITEIVDALSRQDLFRLKKIRRASESKALQSPSALTANEKIIRLLKENGATEDYCGGTGKTAYMDDELYTSNGISVTVQDWICPEYPQLYNSRQGFIPNLSILDLLMNVPIDTARMILKG